MNYRDVDAVIQLCQKYGVVEVIAAVAAHSNQAVEGDYKDNKEAIIHQYAPVVNASLLQLVNIRNERITSGVAR
jgi:hypothetical protein